MSTSEQPLVAPGIKVGEARHAFELPLSCEEAFPLFTALGEKRWVEGWAPDVLVGDGLAPAVGDVFATAAHGRRFVWTVVDVDRDRDASGGRQVRYVRVSDHFQVGEIEVRCTPAAPAASAGACRVEVRYRLVGMGDEGPAHVEAFFAPGAFDAFIDSWPLLITTALARERERT